MTTPHLTDATIPAAPAHPADDAPVPELRRPRVQPGGGMIARRVRRAVLAMLEANVRHGRLTMVLPDGEVRSFGPEGHPRAATITIHSDRLFGRIARHGRMAPGDGFVAGEWSADDPATVLEILARTVSTGRASGLARLVARARRLRPRRAWRSTRRTAPGNVRAHYDLGNDLFSTFLDPTMAYSCAVFEHPGMSLEAAQVAKFERICSKLQLTAGDRLLDIGCGWGGFACHAARTRGVSVVGVTLSLEQHAAAVERVRREGLEHLVEVRLMDYRDVEGRFDKIASIEMFEAIGVGEFRRFFSTVDRLLEVDGIACMQTIALPDQQLADYLRNEDWIQRHIFPGGQLPSLEAMQVAMRAASSLLIHDVEEIGPHYATTLAMWRERFLHNLDHVRTLGYAEEFERVFAYYLYFCEAGFRARILRDVQLVLTRPMNDALPLLRG